MRQLLVIAATFLVLVAQAIGTEARLLAALHEAPVGCDCGQKACCLSETTTTPQRAPIAPAAPAASALDAVNPAPISLSPRLAIAAPPGTQSPQPILLGHPSLALYARDCARLI